MSIYSDLLSKQSDTPDLTKAQTSSDAWAFNGGAVQWWSLTDNWNFIQWQESLVDPVVPTQPVTQQVEKPAEPIINKSTNLFDDANKEIQAEQDSWKRDSNWKINDSWLSFFSSLFNVNNKARSNTDSFNEWMDKYWAVLNPTAYVAKELVKKWIKDAWLNDAFGIKENQTDKLNKIAEEKRATEEAKAKSEFSKNITKDYMEWVRWTLKENKDPYVQNVIQEWANQMTDQFNWMYDIIRDTEENSSFNKWEWTSKMNNIVSWQKEFFKEFSRQMLKNDTDAEAYDATIAQEKFRKIASDTSNFYIDLRDASVGSAMDWYKQMIHDWNIVDKLWWTFQYLSNWLSNLINQWWTLLEKWKQKTIWWYDVSEELAHLNVQRKWASLLTKWLWSARWAWAEIIDAVPQFLPEVLSMFWWAWIASKVSKIWKVSKILEWLNSTKVWKFISDVSLKHNKIATFWKEFTKNILYYDVIWRWMLDRGTNSDDVKLDLLISWWLSAVIWRLASPIIKDNKLFWDTLSKFSNWEQIIDDEAIRLFKSWDYNWALSRVSKMTSESLIKWETATNDALKIYSDADRNNMTQVIKQFSKDSLEWKNTSIKFLAESKWKNVADVSKDKWYTENIKNRQAFESGNSSALSWTSTAEDASKSLYNRKTVDHILKESYKLNPDINNKMIISYMARWIADGKIQTTIFDNLIKPNSPLKESIYNALDWNAANFIANMDAWILWDAFLYMKQMFWIPINWVVDLSKHITSEAQIKEFRDWLQVLVEWLWKKAVVDNNLIPKWAILWKVINVWDQNTPIYKDIITWNDVLKNDIKFNESPVESLSNTIASIEEKASKLSDDITDTLDIKDLFVKWLDPIDPSNAWNILKSIIKSIWIDAKNFIFTKSEIWDVVWELKRIISWWIDMNNLTAKQMWVVKLMLFKPLYKTYEEANIILWVENSKKYITAKWFNNNNVFWLWKKQWWKYVLNINWPSWSAIPNYIIKVLKLNISAEKKAELFSHLWITNNVVWDVLKWKSWKTILKESVDNIDVLSLEKNSSLKNKVIKSLNDMHDINLSDARAEDLVAILSDIKWSKFNSNSFMNELSQLDKSIQSVIIDDVLRKTMEDSTVWWTIKDIIAAEKIVKKDIAMWKTVNKDWVCPTFI